MKQILDQLSQAWNMAETLYDQTENPDEKAEIKKRMDQIASLMEETLSRTFTKNEEFYRQAVTAFKKNQKDIEAFKKSLERSDMVARVDLLLQNVGG